MNDSYGHTEGTTQGNEWCQLVTLRKRTIDNYAKA